MFTNMSDTISISRTIPLKNLTQYFIPTEGYCKYLIVRRACMYYIQYCCIQSLSALLRKPAHLHIHTVVQSGHSSIMPKILKMIMIQ